MKIRPLFFLPLFFLIISCDKATQWKEKKALNNLEFLTFEKKASEKNVKKRLSAWNIDFTFEKTKHFSSIETQWITFRKVEYSQIFFYFNEKEELFKIKAYVPGYSNGKKLLDRMKKKFAETRIRGQKPKEHYFKGLEEEKASLKYNSTDEVWSLEMSFSPN